MKAKSAGNNTQGFSTLELMIAFAIMSIVLTGALSANAAAQYWSVSSQTSNEGLYKAKTKLEDLRALIKQDFYQATSSPLTISIDPSDPTDASCIAHGLCYYVQATITDLSSCSKYAQASVYWNVAGSFGTTSTSLFTNLTNSNEAISLGGDCLLNQPSGNWSNTPQLVGSLTFNPGKVSTGIDVLHGEIYLSASTSPYLSVYTAPTSVPQNPLQTGSISTGVGLNDVDAAEDLSTGRSYAYVVENSTTTQLGVYDVTDPTSPSLVAERQLAGTNPPSGSYPQGWRIFAYGNRLYVVTRETSGDELHIFNVNVPVQPVEVGTSAELNRTVSDLVVREQKISGVTHRLLYLASDADTKELGIFDVTNDTPTEISSVDLPGTQDGKSLYLLGNRLYFGRASNASGPELYVFDVTNPMSATLPIIGQGEVGADVLSIRVSGSYAYVGTTKSGQELQVWNTNLSTWNPAILNAGRFSSVSFSNLVQLDVEGNYVYAMSASVGSDA